MKKLIYRYSLQLKESMILFFIISIFLTSACIDKINLFNQHKFIFVFTIVLDAVCIMGLFYLFYRYIKTSVRSVEFYMRFKQCKVYVLILIYSFLIRLPQMNDLPRWDGGVYYARLVEACDNFNFTFSQYFNEFRLFKHPTLGYASIWAIGEFWTNGKYIGLFIVELFLLLITAVFLYQILEISLSQCSQYFLILATMVLTSTPLILGTFSYINIDEGTFYFLIIMVFFYIKKRYILFAFSMLILSQTKEIGAVIIGMFVIGVLLFHFSKNERPILTKVKDAVKSPAFICAFIIGSLYLIFLIYIKMQGAGSWSLESDQANFSTFSLQPEFVIHKLKQFYLLNFNWIITIMNLIFISYYIIKVKKKKKIGIKDFHIGFLFVYFSLIVFYCGYITHELPRYQIVIDFLNVFLVILLIGNIFEREIVKIVITSVVLVVFITQSYITIDSVSLKTFGAFSTGKGNIIETTLMSNSWQGDFCVYNHQYTYLDKAYQKVLKLVEYDDNMDIIVYEEIKDSAVAGGKGYDEKIYWNLKDGRSTFCFDGNVIKFSSIYGVELENDIQKKQRAVYIYTPQYGTDNSRNLESIQKFYNITDSGKVVIPFEGEVLYYLCELKNTINL